MKTFSVLLLVLLPYLGTCSVRATWISTYDSQIHSESSAEQLLQTLKSVGISKVYLSVWWNGNLYARSSTYSNLMGSQPDYLSNVVNAANRVGGISVTAWFEYGTMAAYGSSAFSSVAQSKGWVIGTHSGFVWCDPSNNDFANFLVNMISEVNSNYRGSGFMGVQLDDHTAWPSALSGPSNSARQDAIDSLVKRISQAVGSSYLSIAPNIMPNSLNDYNANWPRWMDNYWAYEVLPQTYRSDLSSFESTLNSQLSYVSGSKLIAGLRCNGSGGDTYWSNLQSMIEYSNQKGIKGVSVWYDKCIYSTYYNEFQNYWG